MIRIRRIGINSGDLAAKYATGVIDVFDCQLFGGQFRRCQIGQGSCFRPQTAKHELGGFGTGIGCVGAGASGAGATSGERHDRGGYYCGDGDGQLSHALHVCLLHMNHHFLSWLR